MAYSEFRPGTSAHDRCPTMQEADMNIWDAFGVSPKTALLAAAAGLVVAVVMALVAFKRDRDHDRQSLNLDGD